MKQCLPVLVVGSNNNSHPSHQWMKGGNPAIYYCKLDNLSTNTLLMALHTGYSYSVAARQ